VAAGIAITSNLTMRNTVRHLSEYTIRQAEASGEFNYQLVRAIAKAQAFYYTRKGFDRLEAQRLFQAVLTYEAGLQTAPAATDAVDPQLVAEQAALHQRRRALLERAQQEFADLVKAADEENDLAARQAVVALIQTDRESGQLADDMDALLDRETAAASVVTNTLIQRGLYSISLAFVLLALLVPLILVLLQRQIVRPIKRLSSAFGLVAGGDLTPAVAITAADEIGGLQRGFNQMLGNLQQQRDQLTRNQEVMQERAADLEQTLAELRQSLSERDQLSQAIRELSSPVIPVVDGVLVMPLIGVIDSQRAALLTQALLAATTRHAAHTVILDVTGVPIIDTQVARVLLQSAEAVRLLGSQTIIVGLRPELAQTIVGLGLDLAGLVAHADLRSGIEYATQRRREGYRPGHFAGIS
jgi:rsbT co-antagonist protein RsbR